MAETDFGSLTTQQKKVWSALVWQAGRDESFFMGNKGFMGSNVNDATKPIHYVNELTATERGHKCIMPLVQDLVGDGTAGDNQLEGNEEALVADDVEITIDQFRHGVKNKGRMAEQRVVIRFRVVGKAKLAFWLGDKVDEMMFLTASGVPYTTKLDNSARPGGSQLPTLAWAADVTAPSTNRKIFAGAATGTNNLTTSDKMTWNLLVKSKAAAIRKRIKPVRINGAPTYIIVMSAEQARDLKTDSDYKTIVAQGSNRGKDNELFTGAFAKVDNLVLYEHNKVYTTQGNATKWGSGNTVEGAQALLLGAQALGYARIGEFEWAESDQTDYKNKKGIGYGGIIGILKPKFKSIFDNNNSEDFSVLAIYTAAAV